MSVQTENGTEQPDIHHGLIGFCRRCLILSHYAVIHELVAVPNIFLYIGKALGEIFQKTSHPHWEDRSYHVRPNWGTQASGKVQIIFNHKIGIQKMYVLYKTRTHTSLSTHDGEY